MSGGRPARKAPPTTGRKRAPRQRAAERPRVVVVGDAVVPTGFARVLHSLISNLKERYEFHHLGINYRGEAHGCGSIASIAVASS